MRGYGVLSVNDDNIGRLRELYPVSLNHHPQAGSEAKQALRLWYHYQRAKMCD